MSDKASRQAPAPASAASKSATAPASAAPKSAKAAVYAAAPRSATDPAPAATVPAVPTVHLASGTQKRNSEGHPWVYRNQIERIEGTTADGETVLVLDHRGRTIGSGLYNSRSMISVRLYSRHDEPLTESLVAGRVRAAIAHRRLFARPDTDCTRLIFAESDRLPGIIADRFGPAVVLQNLSLGMERFLPLIADTILAETGASTLYLRNSDAIREKEGLPLESRLYAGEPLPEAEIREHGVRLFVSLQEGQKTGYFLDQKANHAYIANFAAGRRVLDCFTYIGGFALHAALAGAASVTAVDSSAPALALAARNAAANGLAEDAIRWVEANAFDYLREAVRAHAAYDLIVLDPPAFAKSHAALEAATRGYKEINLSALRLLGPGGILATHSCSYHMKEELFVETVLAAARDARKTVRILDLRRQDHDHPVLAGYPESHYLKSLWLQVVE